MATKGASNRYGNSRGSSPGRITEHTGFAWAKDFNKILYWIILKDMVPKLNQIQKNLILHIRLSLRILLIEKIV